MNHPCAAQAPRVDAVVVFDEDWCACPKRCPADWLQRLQRDLADQAARSASPSKKKKAGDAPAPLPAYRLVVAGTLDAARFDASRAAPGDWAGDGGALAAVKASLGARLGVVATCDANSTRWGGLVALAGTALGKSDDDDAPLLLGGTLPDAAAVGRVAAKIDKATRRAEMARASRGRPGVADDDVAMEEEAREGDADLFYAALDEGDRAPGALSVPLALEGPFDLSVARLPLRDAAGLVHNPEWLRSCRVETLNRRVRYAAAVGSLGRRHGKKSKRLDPPPWIHCKTATSPRHRSDSTLAAGRKDSRSGSHGSQRSPRSNDDAARAKDAAQAVGPEAYARCLDRVWTRDDQWESRMPQEHSGRDKDARPMGPRSFLAYLGGFGARIPTTGAAKDAGADPAPPAESFAARLKTQHAALSLLVATVEKHRGSEPPDPVMAAADKAAAAAPPLEPQPDFEDQAAFDAFFKERGLDTPDTILERARADKAAKAAKDAEAKKLEEAAKAKEAAAADAAANDALEKQREKAIAALKARKAEEERAEAKRVADEKKRLEEARAKKAAAAQAKKDAEGDVVMGDAPAK